MTFRVLVAISLLSTALAGQSPSRPNVVVLFADDLGWRDLGCTGSDFYETPNIDRLAASGLRFTNAYAAAPVCSPTRAALMTGKYPARLGTTDDFEGGRKGRLLPVESVDRLALSEVTLAEAMGVAGYRTAFLGKWHLGGEEYAPEKQGFGRNFGGCSWGHPSHGYFSPWKNPALDDGEKGEHLTDHLTDRALQFIEEAGSEPFLLFFSYYLVHTPLQAKSELIAKYERKAAAAAEKRGDVPQFLPEGRRRTRQFQDHAVYAAMVETLDTSVGRILDSLEARGLAERTLVVFTSDNGGLSTSEGHPTSNVPLRAGKGWLYEGGLRVPLILRGPGVARVGVADPPVITPDLYPTILAAVGAEAPGDDARDGVDLAPVLGDAAAELEREAIFWHYPHYGNQGGSPGGAVRVGRHKLIENFETGRAELYDLVADPAETEDLVGRDATTATELLVRLRSWRRNVDARMPRPNPDYEKRFAIALDGGEVPRSYAPVRVRLDVGRHLDPSDLDGLSRARVVVIREGSRRAPCQVEIVRGASGPTGLDVVWIQDELPSGGATVELRLTRDPDHCEWVGRLGRFAFADGGGRRELTFAGQPIWRFPNEFDANDYAETFKPFHHLYGFLGDGAFLTKAAGGLFSHHRGLFLGWSTTRTTRGTFDFWAGADGRSHQRHVEFDAAVERVGPVFARCSSTTEWRSPDGTAVVRDRRRVTTWRQLPGRHLIDFEIELSAVDGPVELDGDAAHGGFQFRAPQTVADGQSCRYVYPAAAVSAENDDWSHCDWVAALFEAATQSVAVVLMNDPENPGPVIFNTRKYGRFGAFFRARLGVGSPMTLRYRVVAVDRDLDKELSAASLQRLHEAWVRPVEVGIEPIR